MCGLAGFIDFSANLDRDILLKMTDSLSHRGPDASGYFFDTTNRYRIGLGHRRLSIIDLTPSGNQPMHFMDSRYTIVFNGEIYNYQEIRDELISLKHEFLSHSDTEVILHAYHEWGEKAVNRFVGMFAYVIYDAASHKLICCRDRPGTKPFFYFWNEDKFLFGSELKSLMANPCFEKSIDMDAVAAFMQYGYVPGPSTIFKKTYKLNPGHYLTMDLTSKKIETIKYWDVYDAYNQEKLKISLPDSIAETEKILEKAFKYRMVADVPVGVFLSGGYDSSCLAALLQKDSTDRLKTFTIGVEDDKMNEAPMAKEIAKLLGTDHREYLCTISDALNIVPDLPYYYDEPFADSSAIPTMLVSKIARESVTVALSADAGDEIFGGYGRYKWIRKNYQFLNSIPDFIGRAGSGLLKAIPVEKIGPLRENYKFLKKYEKLHSMLADPGPLNVFMGSIENYSRMEKQKLFKDKTHAIESAHFADALKKEYFDPVSYSMAKDYQTYLVDDILQKVDRATMSVALEGREPFLDHNIIEWAAKLPMEHKLAEGHPKFILRQIVHKYLPESLMNREKRGFTIPVDNWLNGALKPLVEKYLSEKYIKDQNIFNPGYVQSIKHSFYVLKSENTYKIWFLLMFQMWYDKWMLGN